MNNNLEKLHKIDKILAKLVDGNNLSAKEAEDLIYHLFVYDTEGLHYAAFIGAIHAKGETADELLGFLNAVKRLGTKFNFSIKTNKITDTSGTGAGEFKTINVSTAAAFVVAVAGYTVPKIVYYGVTSPTGSADIFSAFGVDFLKLSKDKIENSLNEIGVCPLIVSFISPKLKNQRLISKKFFIDRQIKIRSIFNLVANIYSPTNMSNRIYGCYSEKYLEIIANLFARLGFKKTLTFHAKIGMPEISNVGETIIVEQNSKEIKKYIVKPSDLGVIERTKLEIKSDGKKQNIIDFINILKGKQEDAKFDLVAINAGAALYALNDVKDITEGTKKAQEILRSGDAYTKFKELIKKIGNPKLLKKYN